MIIRCGAIEIRASDWGDYSALWSLWAGRRDMFAVALQPVGQGGDPLLGGYEAKAVGGAIDLATKLTGGNEGCDQAFQEYGITSLNALVSQYKTAGAGANIFDGQKTSHPYAKNPAIGAWVTGTGSKNPKTYVGKPFFKASGGTDFDQERAVIIIHEAIHHFGGLHDVDFDKKNKNQITGSNNITNRIIEKCAPLLKNKPRAIIGG